MTMLDTMLQRIPAERREAFLLSVHALNISPDSPDLVQAFLAVEALAPMLDAFTQANADLPGMMKAAGAEIVRGLADSIAAETTERISKEGIARIEAHAIALFAGMEQRLDATLQAFGDGTVSVTRSMDARTKEAVDRIESATSKVNIHAHDVKIHHERGVEFMAGVYKKLWIALGIAAVLGMIAMYGFDHGAGMFHALRGAMHR